MPSFNAVTGTNLIGSRRTNDAADVVPHRRTRLVERGGSTYRTTNNTQPDVNNICAGQTAPTSAGGGTEPLPTNTATQPITGITECMVDQCTKLCSRCWNNIIQSRRTAGLQHFGLNQVLNVVPQPTAPTINTKTPNSQVFVKVMVLAQHCAGSGAGCSMIIFNY